MDYPFEDGVEIASWFDGLEMNTHTKEKMAYENAITMLKLGPRNEARGSSPKSSDITSSTGHANPKVSHGYIRHLSAMPGLVSITYTVQASQKVVCVLVPGQPVPFPPGLSLDHGTQIS